MGEPARVSAAPAPSRPRGRPALYSDHLPEEPMPRAERRDAAWVFEQLVRLAFIVAVIAWPIAILWRQR